LIFSGGGAKDSFLQFISDIFEIKLILIKKGRTVLGVLKTLFPSVIQLNNSNMDGGILFFPKRVNKSKVRKFRKGIKDYSEI
tara:strand:+ start:393 stop:638 length:246 start_codon:yes stop_codon:yes gene_type:complete